MSERFFEKGASYRAKVKVNEDGEIVIKPEEKGKPIKKNVVDLGASQMYTTTGQKNPKRVIMLSVPEKSGDIVGDMKKEFDAFVVEMGGTPSPDPLERPLQTKDARLEVWLSKDRHELVVKKTVNLAETPDYSTVLSNLEGELRTCLLINRTNVLSACLAR